MAKIRDATAHNEKCSKQVISSVWPETREISTTLEPQGQDIREKQPPAKRSRKHDSAPLVSTGHLRVDLKMFYSGMGWEK